MIAKIVAHSMFDKEYKMPFKKLQAWLESWGLSPDDDHSIPYPTVYQKMLNDSANEQVRNFIPKVTDTTDGQTYLNVGSWDELWEEWNLHCGGN